MGYVEVNLKISELKAFIKDMLVPMMEDRAYAQVPIQLVTLHMHRALDLVSEKGNSSIINRKNLLP